MHPSARSFSLSLAAAAAFLGPAASSDAALLLEESFAYAPGTIAGNSGGTGFEAGSSYSVSSSGAATGTGTVAASSLTFSDYAIDGGSLTISTPSGTGTVNTLVDRATGFGVTSGNLWSAFLYSRDDAEGNASRTAEVRLAGGSPAFSTQPKRGSSDSATLRYDGSTGPGAGSFQGGDTFLYVTKFADVGTTGATASLWVLSASDYDAIKSGGVTEAELGTPLETDSLAATDSRTVSAGELLRLVSATSQFPFAFSVDELRYGTELVDVVPVPEPGSLALGAAGAVLLLTRRRK